MKIQSAITRMAIIAIVGFSVGLSAQEYNFYSDEYISHEPRITVSGLDVFAGATLDAFPMEFHFHDIDPSSPISDWNVKVVDSKGREIWQTSGTGSIPKSLRWDGIGPKNQGLNPLAKYYVYMQAATKGEKRFLRLKSEFITGIPVKAETNGLRLLIPELLFQGDGESLFSNDPSLRDINGRKLRNLAAKLRDIGEYRIIIRGHALPGEPVKHHAIPTEQYAAWKNLSLKRAAAVRDALYLLGVDWPRMEIQGRGELEPLFAPEDRANNWKNQRVEIFLVE